jgi:phosphate transport system substrate-binding protein
MGQKTFSILSLPGTFIALSHRAAVMSSVVCCLLAAPPAVSAQTDSALKPYAPQRVAPPAEAKYVLPDGSIYIAGNDLMVSYLERLNALFQKYHPGFKFKMDLYTSGLSVSGINSGKSALGPIARDPSFQEINAFASRHGYPPTDIQVGWDNTPDADHSPPGKYPPGVWVNARNPTPWLSMEDVAAIFTTGSGKGDFTFWGQIYGHEGFIGGNNADYAKREIHVYLPKLERLPILSTMRFKLGGRPWTPRAEHLPMVEDVINAVANDPFGIGLIGWWPTDEGWDRQVELGDKIKFLPISVDKHSKPSRGRPGDLHPLAGGLRFMVDKVPGKPPELWIKEYLRLALSKEGQELIASMTTTNGFIPLDPKDVARELAKLE